MFMESNNTTTKISDNLKFKDVPQARQGDKYKKFADNGPYPTTSGCEKITFQTFAAKRL